MKGWDWYTAGLVRADSWPVDWPTSEFGDQPVPPLSTGFQP